MHPTRLLTLLLLCGPAFAASGSSDATAPADAELRAAVRAVMALDPYPTLVTLDAEGHPRARTLEVSAPDADFVLWMATRPGTRKVAQLRADDRATVHYAADEAGAYVSVMGHVTLHDDAETIRAHTFQDEAALRAFWPDWPDDYLLLRIEPDWIEVVGAGAEADPGTWRPQRLDP